MIIELWGFQNKIINNFTVIYFYFINEWKIVIKNEVVIQRINTIKMVISLFMNHLEY